MVCQCQIPHNEPPNITSLSLWPSLCPPWHDRDLCEQDGKEKVRCKCPIVETELLLNYSVTLPLFCYITLLYLFVWLRVDHNGLLFLAYTWKELLLSGLLSYVALETNNRCRYRNNGTREKDTPLFLPHTTLHSSGSLTVLFSDVLRFTRMHVELCEF